MTCIPGLVGDGIHDDAPAIQAALDSAGTGSDPNGDTYHLPRGKFRCGSNIHIRRRLILNGAGGDPQYPASDLVFDDGFGLVIDRKATSSDGGSADWATVQNMRIISAGDTVPDIDGIRVHARCILNHVYVLKFSRHGVNVSAGIGQGPGGINTNANCCQFTGVRCTNNGGDGMHFQGSDANACHISHCDCSGNGGWGFGDSSFLGNAYDMCHTSHNTAGPYLSTSNNNSGGFVMCYSEAGQPPSNIQAPAMVLGGTHGAGFTPDSTGFILSQHPSGARCIGGQLAFQRDTGVSFVPTPNDGTQTAFQFDTAESQGRAYRLRRNAVGGFGGWWHLLAGNSATQAAIAFAEEGNEQGYREGSTLFPYGFYLAEKATAGLERFFGSAAASPTTGEWQAGSRIFNRNPTPAKPISHWICVTSGTPGTWRAVGTGAGTTVERPTLTAGDAGFTFYDRTIAKMIHWSGTGWDE